jgi:hypothetical protein
MRQAPAASSAVSKHSLRDHANFLFRIRLIESGWQLIVERCQIEVRAL